MFRALGTVLLLWYLSSVFSQSFSALDDALTASLGVLEATAITSKHELEVRE